MSPSPVESPFANLEKVNAGADHACWSADLQWMIVPVGGQDEPEALYLREEDGGTP